MKREKKNNETKKKKKYAIHINVSGYVFNTIVSLVEGNGEKIAREIDNIL